MNIPHRTVPLDKNGSRIEFDYNEGRYRVAYYYPVYDESGRRITEEKRCAAKHPDLRQALQIVFGETDAPHDPETVEHYMRTQKWSRELP